MPPRTCAAAGLLDTPASNMNEHEYDQDTHTIISRGAEMGSQMGGQVNDNTMVRMMMVE